jgi:Domain of unknown function (DUF4391)
MQRRDTESALTPNKRTFAMLVDDILPALDLPAAAVQNRSISKGSLMVHGLRPTEDEDRILNEIASIRLLATIDAVSAEVPPYLHRVHEYRNVGILAVEPLPNVKRDLLMEAIHTLVPNPVVLFFFRDGAVFEISLAHKRLRLADWPRTAIDGELNTCPLGDTPVDAEFFKSVRWSDLPQKNLFTVYRAWHERLEALKAARLTGKFTLCATKTQTIRRRRLLEEYVRQFRDRRRECDHLTDELYMYQRDSIECEIVRIDAKMKSIRNRLRMISDTEANAGTPTADKRNAVLGPDEGDMALPALP